MSNPNAQKPTSHPHPVGSPSKPLSNPPKGSSNKTSNKSSSKSTSLPISKLIEAEKHVQQQQQRMQQQKQPQRIKPTPAPTHSHLPSSGSGSSIPSPPLKVTSSHGSRGGESSKLPELLISPGKPSTSNSSRSSASSNRGGTASTENGPKKRIIEVGKPNPSQAASKASQSKVSLNAKSKQKTAAAKSNQSAKTEQKISSNAKIEQQSKESFKPKLPSENQPHPHPPSSPPPSSMPPSSQKEPPSPKLPSKSAEPPAPRSTSPKSPSNSSEKVLHSTESKSPQLPSKPPEPVSEHQSAKPEKPKDSSKAAPSSEAKQQPAQLKPAEPQTAPKPASNAQIAKEESKPDSKPASDSSSANNASKTASKAASDLSSAKDATNNATKTASNSSSANNAINNATNNAAKDATKTESKAVSENQQSNKQVSDDKAKIPPNSPSKSAAPSDPVSQVKSNELSSTAKLSLSSSLQGAVTSASTEPDVDVDVENAHVGSATVRKKEPDVPMSELGDEMKTKTFNISTLFRMTFADVTIELTPDFRELDEKEYNASFLGKVKECKKICDWSIGIKDVEAKKNKKILLIQLIELFESQNGLQYIERSSIDKFISMVVHNISRPFPPTKIINPLFDFDDVTQDMAWPHLALVYEALLKLLMTPLQLTIRHPTFVSVLVTNSCSPDERERMAVRDNLKLLFVKCPEMQDAILRLVQNQFLTGACSHQILEFILAVLDEVGRPLPQNLIGLYKNSILFLHSSKMFLSFYKAFFAVVNRFVRYERSLLRPTMEFLVRHWPSSTVRKQLVFMSELEGLTLNYFEDVDEEIAKLVFRQLSELVNQPNIDIAETALNVLLGPALEEPLLKYSEAAIKILTQELMNAANKNWNDYVQEDSKLALQMLSDLNPKFFKTTVSKLKEERKKKKTYQGIWRTNWKKVVESAKLNDNTITSANMDMLF